MAAATSNGAEASADDVVRKPPPDVVIPPKGIRVDLEKTADYIYRQGAKGADFQNRLWERNMTNPKFSFLDPDDPYHSYYAWLLSELRAGRQGQGAGAQDAQSQKDNKPKGPPAPPEFRFSYKMPNISAKDLEILKLTALYTAKHGQGWMRQLSQRESGNFQFDFLRPQHSFNPYFTRLVDQYTILLHEQKTQAARIEELRRNIEDRFRVLDQAKQRAEYVKHQEQQKAQEEKKVEEEKKEYASIDWQDFVIVATVTFDEADDQADLPPPTSLNDLQSQSLEQKAMTSLQPTNRRIEEAAPDDVTYYNAAPSQAPMPMQMPPPQPMQPVYQPQPPAPADYKTPAQIAQEEEEERRIRERQAEQERAQQAFAAAKGTGPMRIRSDYVPRAAAKKQNAGMALCPNCKQQVPYDELEEHMRIELLDPRWKEQKAKSDARYATTNLSTADVANNLKRLASQRDDVFDGVTGMPISEEEAARRKKAATQYDGQPDPAKDAARLQQMQSMNVNEQLRQIEQKYKQK